MSKIRTAADLLDLVAESTREGQKADPYAKVKFDNSLSREFFERHLDPFLRSAGGGLRFNGELSDPVTIVTMNLPTDAECGECHQEKLILVKVVGIWDRRRADEYQRQHGRHGNVVIYRDPAPQPEHVGNTYYFYCPKCQKGFVYKNRWYVRYVD